MHRAVVLFLMVAVGGAVCWLAARTDGQSKFAEVEQALENRKFKEAGDLLQNYLEVHPDDSSALILAAQTARRNDVLLKASEYLQTYEQMNGSRDAALLERRLGSIQNGDFREAAPLLASCESRPDVAETPLILEAFLKGVVKNIEGAPSNEPARDMSKAIWAADLWLAKRPSRADQSIGFLWRGKINQYADKHADAVADLRKAVAVDEENIPARLGLAKAIAQEDPVAAIGHIRFVLEKNPDDMQAAFMLATGLGGLGQFDESRRVLDALLKRDPNNYQIVLERGKIDLESLQLDQAEPYLRRAEKLAPNDLSVLNSFYRFFCLKGNAEEALKYRERFTQLNAEQKKALELKKKDGG